MVTNIENIQFSQRLNAILDEIKFPPKGKNRQTLLGNMFGVGQKGARKWLEGESIPKQTRHSEFIEKFREKGAEITGEWLFRGNPLYEPDWYKHQKHIRNETIGYENISNLEPCPNISGRVPLINYVQAGHWREIMENFEPEYWIETTTKVSNKSFALRVVGDSMTNPMGAPSIPNGYIIIVDPLLTPQSGSFVVARLENSNEALFKQLIIDGPHHYLKSLNPDYKPIYIDESCVIVGVVKKSQFDL